MTEPFVRPDVRLLLDMIVAAGRPPIEQQGPAAGRDAMRAMTGLLEAPTGDIAILRDLDFTTDNGIRIPMRLFDARASRGPGPVVLFLHGGGFVLGDLDCYQPLCAEIARTLDLPVVAVDYRLAPEHRWPAAAQDCEAAARWIASAPAELGRGVSSLVVMGDSAGGMLTINISMALRDTPAAVPVIAQCPIYPVIEMDADAADRDYPSHIQFGDGYALTRSAMEWFADCYAIDAKVAGGRAILADQGGMPPTLVVTAGLDPLRDQGRAYAAACIQSGVATVYREAKGTIHGFCTTRKAIPSAQGDLAALLAALKPMILEAEAGRSMAEAG